MAFLLEERHRGADGRRRPIQMHALLPRYAQSSLRTTTIENNSTNTEISSFSIGRDARRSAIAVPGDRSVSKSHCVLACTPAPTAGRALVRFSDFEVKHNSVPRSSSNSGGIQREDFAREREDFVARMRLSSALTIRDAGSKTGTRVNRVAVTSDRTLKVGDIIAVGGSDLVDFVVRQRPMIVCCTRLTASLVDSVKQWIRRIGGFVLDDSEAIVTSYITSEWVHITHLVTNEILPTPKVAFALMCGAHFVTTQFIEACLVSPPSSSAHERRPMKFPDEADFEPAISPDSQIQRMPLFDPQTDGPVSASQFRPLVVRGNCVAAYVATLPTLVKVLDDAVRLDAEHLLVVPLTTKSEPREIVESIMVAVSAYNCTGARSDIKLLSDLDNIMWAVFLADTGVLIDESSRADAISRAEEREVQRIASRSAATSGSAGTALRSHQPNPPHTMNDVNNSSAAPVAAAPLPSGEQVPSKQSTLPADWARIKQEKPVIIRSADLLIRAPKCESETNSENLAVKDDDAVVNVKRFKRKGRPTRDQVPVVVNLVPFASTLNEELALDMKANRSRSNHRAEQQKSNVSERDRAAAKEKTAQFWAKVEAEALAADEEQEDADDLFEFGMAFQNANKQSRAATAKRAVATKPAAKRASAKRASVKPANARQVTAAISDLSSDDDARAGAKSLPRRRATAKRASAKIANAKRHAAMLSEASSEDLSDIDCGKADKKRGAAKWAATTIASTKYRAASALSESSSADDFDHGEVVLKRRRR